MQVQAIASNVTFKSDNKQIATDFINMDNSQLMCLAQIKSYNKDEQNRQQKSISRVFWAIPIVDSLANGILKEGSLATKAEASAKSAKSWGVIIAAVGLYNGAKKVFTKNSDTSKTFDNKHPILSLMCDVGLILTGLAVAGVGFGKIKEQYPEAAKKLAQKIESTKTAIDNHKLNKEVLPKISEQVGNFAKKFPVTTALGKLALASSMWILLGAAIAKGIKNSHNDTKKVKRNYRELKNQQNEIAKSLVNVLSAENEVLTKNQQNAEKNVNIILVNAEDI